MQSAGIALWSCGNNDGALHLAEFLVRHGRTVMLVIDADSRVSGNSMFKQSRLEQTFGSKASDVVKLLGEKSGAKEFEELFSDDLWARAANVLWQTSEGWTPDQFKELRQSGKFSTKVLDMLRKSEEAPDGKPEMMFRLATFIAETADVPYELREAFAEVRQLAN